MTTSGNVQFSRYIEIEVRDFESKTKTVIGNEFEINFSHFKTIDQSLEDDSGSVVIFGLTEKRIESLQSEGGEIRIKCGYLGGIIDTVVIASISRVYTEKSDNTSRTTIEFSANLKNHYITDSFTNSGRNLSPVLILSNIAKSIGYPNLEIDLEGLSETQFSMFQEWVTTAKTNLSLVGSADEMIKNVTEYWGLSWTQVDGIKIVVTPLQSTINGIAEITSRGYAKVKTQEVLDNSITFLGTLEADIANPSTLILNYSTGLLSSNKEYKISYAYSDQIVEENQVAEDATPDGVKYIKPQSQGDVDSNPFVGNEQLSGLVLKPNATNNGNPRKLTVAFAKIVSSHFGYDVIERFTSFNDKFHVPRGGRHPKGQAFDFTLKLGTKTNATKITKEVKELAKKTGFDVKLLDEYNYPSEGATGDGHIHVSVIGIGDSNNYYPQYDKNGSAPLRRRVSVTYNKEYRRVKALLNPRIKPQSIVAIFLEQSNDTSEFSEDALKLGATLKVTYNICRVRSVSFVANNKRGDWTMELLCEDTDQHTLDEREVQKILYTNSEGSVNIQEAVDSKKPKKAKKDKDDDVLE